MSSCLSMLMQDARLRGLNFANLNSFNCCGGGYVDRFSWPAFPSTSFCTPFASMRFPTSMPMPVIPPGIGINTSFLDNRVYTGNDLTKLMYIPQSVFAPQEQIPSAQSIITAMMMKSYAEERGRMMAEREIPQIPQLSTNIFRQDNQNQGLQLPSQMNQNDMMQLMMIFMAMLAQMANMMVEGTPVPGSAAPQGGTPTGVGTQLRNGGYAPAPSVAPQGGLQEGANIGLDSFERTEDDTDLSAGAQPPSGSPAPVPSAERPASPAPDALGDDVDMKDLRHEYDAAAAAEKEAQARAAKLSSELGNLTGEQSAAADRKRTADDALTSAQRDQQQTEEKLKAAEDKVTETQGTVESINGKIAALTAQRDKTTDDAERTKLQEQLAKLKEELTKAEEARDAAVAERNRLQEELTQNTQAVAEAETAAKDAQAALDEAGIAVGAKKDEVTAAEAAENKAHEEAVVADARLKAAKKAVDEESKTRFNNANNLFNNGNGTIQQKKEKFIGYFNSTSTDDLKALINDGFNFYEKITTQMSIKEADEVIATLKNKLEKEIATEELTTVNRQISDIKIKEAKRFLEAADGSGTDFYNRLTNLNLVGDGANAYDPERKVLARLMNDGTFMQDVIDHFDHWWATDVDTRNNILGPIANELGSGVKNHFSKGDGYDTGYSVSGLLGVWENHFDGMPLDDNNFNPSSYSLDKINDFAITLAYTCNDGVGKAIIDKMSGYDEEDCLRNAIKIQARALLGK